MRLSVSGTYAAGKTSTATALSHYTGIPFAPARSIREILPDAVPGKALAEVTPAEYLQLAVRRHVGRVQNEARLGERLISDGSSLQEWIYAAARVRFGMDPAAPAEVPPRSAAMDFFAEAVDQLGHAFRQHVKETYDGFVHLKAAQGATGKAGGHRRMHPLFRGFCDDMLLRALDDLGVTYHVVEESSRSERLKTIAGLFGLPAVRSVEEALELAAGEYAAIDWRLEGERAPSAASLATAVPAAATGAVAAAGPVAAAPAEAGR
ncbi:AAA family ATPase [Streptomyces antimicrobicus]|uniref:AAA family ATPase n=1 Tax=Streptomyces antimicrobicus TaxID=2883108 RepID=A0ABS8B8P3_9ACTN|nr:AAA family ATPase [Streptomyces antimicrobicus]MCB5180975.1 AAA family ATPase [Streptomyces antimicrobicus]